MTEKLILKRLMKEWEEVDSSLLFSGKQWYYLKRNYCDNLAIKYKLTLQQIAGIYAALSPMKSVSENDRLCENFLEGDYSGHFKFQINKAKKIKKEYRPEKIEEILRGDKTKAFFRNIYTPWNDDYVTVDRHQIKICNKGKLLNITPKRYKIIANATKSLAKRVNLHSCETQSCLWLLAKRKYGNNV